MPNEMTAYQHVDAAVAEILPQIHPEELERGVPAAAIVSARLYPYIETSVSSRLSETAKAPAADKRAKPWQLIVRFWCGEELVGETDAEVLKGTGELPEKIAEYAAELHEVCPAELTAEAVKAKLPQLRNNLSRQQAAALRIDYEAADLDDDPVLAGRAVSYRCQADVFRLD